MRLYIYIQINVRVTKPVKRISPAIIFVSGRQLYKEHSRLTTALRPVTDANCTKKKTSSHNSSKNAHSAMMTKRTMSNLRPSDKPKEAQKSIKYLLIYYYELITSILSLFHNEPQKARTLKNKYFNS